MSNKLKTLDPSARSFEAGGKTYHVETKLSIARFHQYQIYEKEAGFSITNIKMAKLSKQEAEKVFEQQRGKPHFN